jgi:hypothetical protein
VAFTTPSRPGGSIGDDRSNAVDKEDAMRRTMVIGLAILAILAVVGIGVGAFNAGVDEGISRELAQRGDADQVVRVVGHGYGYGYGRGFGFPFGLILFPLFVIGIVLLVRGAFWRGRWGGPRWGPGGYGPGGPGGAGGYGPPGPWGQGGPWAPGGQGGPDRFDEWHRRQHEQPAEPASGGEQPASGDEQPPRS